MENNRFFLFVDEFVVQEGSKRVLLRFVTDKVKSVNFWLIPLILVGKNRRVYS